MHLFAVPAAEPAVVPGQWLPVQVVVRPVVVVLFVAELVVVLEAAVVAAAVVEVVAESAACECTAFELD